MDYREVVQQHIDSNADVTVCSKEVPIEEASRFGILEADNKLRINKFVEKPEKPESWPI